MKRFMNEVTWAMCAIFTDSSVISCHIKYNVMGVLKCLTPHAHSLAMVINDLLMELSAGHFFVLYGFRLCVALRGQRLYLANNGCRWGAR